MGDATRDERFAGDGYILASRSKSILCVPVAHQGRLRGILYLENNLTTDAFTPDRIEVMRILAAQTAISLENARLYENMKSEVERRTAAEQALREALSEVEALKNRLEAENVYLQEEIRTQHNFNEIVGNSPALLDTYARSNAWRRPTRRCSSSVRRAQARNCSPGRFITVAGEAIGRW